jgi:hypothetical protein
VIGWILTGIAVAVFVSVIIWALRWKDSSWKESDQADASQWSKGRER